MNAVSVGTRNVMMVASDMLRYDSESIPVSTPMERTW